jgi:hypothetical protein
MSGFYNNWLKVQNPNFTNNNVQMQSNELQVPFYFGGSQVPNALNLKSNEISGSGFNKKIKKYEFHPIGLGKKTQMTDTRGGSVHIPRQLRRV